MTAFLVAVMTLLFSFQSLFCKLFSQKHTCENPAMTPTVFSIVYGAFVGTVTLVLAGFRFAPSSQTLLYGLFNAVILLVYNLAMIEASRGGSYSFQMICVLFGGIVLPLVHQVLFLGGTLSGMQAAAIGMMLIALILLNLKDFSLKGLSLKGSSGKFLLWCAALFITNGAYGILMNMQQREMNGAERNEMIILTYLVMSLLYALWQGIRNREELLRSFRIGRQPMIFLLLCCVSATAAAHLMLYLLTQVEAPILYTIDNGGVLVLSVLYSAILFHEKLNPPQTAGILLSAASIIMLSL